MFNLEEFIAEFRRIVAIPAQNCRDADWIPKQKAMLALLSTVDVENYEQFETSIVAITVAFNDYRLFLDSKNVPGMKDVVQRHYSLLKEVYHIRANGVITDQYLFLAEYLPPDGGWDCDPKEYRMNAVNKHRPQLLGLFS